MDDWKKKVQFILVIIGVIIIVIGVIVKLITL